MVERVEDMQLPNAIVQRIIKEALPEGINVAKDARSEIAKAASIFVLYLTSTARQAKNQKKTLTPADILQALETMEMENFIEPLKKAMEQHKRQQKTKKDRKQQDQLPGSTDTPVTETPSSIPNETETENMISTESEDPTNTMTDNAGDEDTSIMSEN